MVLLLIHMPSPYSVITRLIILIYQPYKWLIFAPLLVLSTIFFVLLGCIVIPFSNDRVASRTAGVWWSRFVGYITPIFVTVTGREHIRENTSYMVVANHQSYYDITVLYGWLGLDIKWVMKQQLRKIPVFGFAGEMGGNIFIDRTSREALERTLEDSRKKIAEGTVSIIMLPEGTRSMTGELGEFKKGPFIIARELDLPILPVSIVGTNRILPAGTFKLFPGRVKMIIHDPVDIRAYKDKETDVLIKDVREIIRIGMDGNPVRDNT
jgi:1-acyl-sn-glycerol-3-phosphate acyltransferase